MSTERIGGIVFDMDGVLLHSSAIHDRAFRCVLEGLPIHGFNYATIAGMRTKDALRTILAANGIVFSDEEIASLSTAKSRMALEWIASDNPVDPDCARVLDALDGDYRLGLASSASAASVNLFLDRNGLRDKFACVLHGGTVKSAKPSPEIYELAAVGLGLAASDCLVIEDSVSGVRAAKTAGALAWAIPNTCRAADLNEAGADRVIGGLGDLLELKGARGWPA